MVRNAASLVFGLVAVAGIGCFKPTGNGLLCSDNRRCPDGLTCYDTAQGSRCYDHAPDAGGAACTHLLCEDFESPATVFQRWGLTHFHADVTLDDALSHGGVHSLHAHLTDPQNDPTVDPTQLVPSQGEIAQEVGPLTDIFMRFFIYVPALPDAPDIRITALEENEADSYPSASLWISAGHLQLTFPDFTAFDSSTRLVVNDWTCVEWEVVVGSGGSVRLWVNGIPADGSPFVGDTTIVGAAADQLAVIGAAVFGPHKRFTAYDLWFDDLAIDSSRIGCN